MERSFFIQRLVLQNFRGISLTEIQFDDSLTLLIGENGVGKTSVLQALLAALCAVWQRSSQYEHILFQLPEDSVRIPSRYSRLQLELSSPATRNWKCDLCIRSEQDAIIELVDSRAADEFIDAVHFDCHLPLLVYYAQDRGSVSNLMLLNQPLASISARGNRQSSLETTVSSLTEFTSWYFEKEAIEGQKIRMRADSGFQDAELKILRNLLDQFEPFSAIKSRKNHFLVAKGHIDLKFESLSSGERVFLLLVLDLAGRLMVAYTDRELSELRGIVFIDDIELHLHPAWQRAILPTLTEIFPACQFVATTQSPQVIGSVGSKHV